MGRWVPSHAGKLAIPSGTSFQNHSAHPWVRTPAAHRPKATIWLPGGSAIAEGGPAQAHVGLSHCIAIVFPHPRTAHHPLT